MPLPTRLYMLIHTPIELARPVCLGIFRSHLRNDKLYAEYVKNAEQARQVHDVRTYWMPKDMAQKWTPYLPSDLRAQLVPIVLPTFLSCETYGMNTEPDRKVHNMVQKWTPYLPSNLSV